jgi:hypothetical protein
MNLWRGPDERTAGGMRRTGFVPGSPGMAVPRVVDVQSLFPHQRTIIRVTCDSMPWSVDATVRRVRRCQTGLYSLRSPSPADPGRVGMPGLSPSGDDPFCNPIPAVKPELVALLPFFFPPVGHQSGDRHGVRNRSLSRPRAQCPTERLQSIDCRSSRLVVRQANFRQ